jgi:hypothetical protein
MALVSADAIRENVIRLRFDRPIYWTRYHDPHDGSFVDRYTVTADPTAIGIDGRPSRPVTVADVQLVAGDGSEVDVWLDRAMSPTGSWYVVTVAGLISAGSPAVPIDPLLSSAACQGVQQGLPRIGLDTMIGNRDIANPALPQVGIRETQLGRFVYDDTHDYGIDQGLVAYKKRVFRRLTSRKGSFAHIPGYGVGIPSTSKSLPRANLTGGIAADAEDQIRQEPETKTVTVTIVQSTADPNLFVYRINATTTIGVVSDWDVPMPFER